MRPVDARISTQVVAGAADNFGGALGRRRGVLPLADFVGGRPWLVTVLGGSYFTRLRTA